MALTAMSMLWNAADLLSKMHQQAEDRGNSTQVLSPEDFDDLLRLLLRALQVQAEPREYSPLVLHASFTAM